MLPPNETPSNQEGSMSMKTKTTQSPYDYYQLLQFTQQHGRAVYGPGFAIADIDRPVVTRLLAYFLRDEAVALAEGLDLNKGLLLTGRIGCGKTSLLHLMRNVGPDDYKPVIISCREISFECSRSGFDVIARYTTNAFFPYTSIPRVHCFDDLGLEAPVQFWGNHINVMAEILLSRYDLFITHKMITHATTNLNMQELEAIYGNRLRSRMRAMFNLVAFHPQTPDKRR